MIHRSYQGLSELIYIDNRRQIERRCGYCHQNKKEKVLDACRVCINKKIGLINFRIAKFTVF
ncbi:MAG: hypothetical protein BGO14_08010 [Chlamydiales bacterium 38-26]|nr:MAG: hypothetical protein BGO14_08010 [Chlamydiales bacterium 38-26]